MPPVACGLGAEDDPERRLRRRRRNASRLGPAAPLTVHVGTSGWSHSHWEHVLYPPGLPSRERLGHYVQRFDTVELNSSFYRWPRSTAFASWRRRLPEGFALYLLEQLPAWMRVAVEFRHPSWHADEVFALLATHQAAYCVMSGA